jgi:lysophospholipase L1-like esterase
MMKEEEWAGMLSDVPADLANYYRTYAWDRHLFYRLRPGLDLPLTDITMPPAIRGRTQWTFHTNSRGFNTDDVPLAKPPGTLRIVALGDSSTFGWGVEPGETYARRLQEILRRRHPGAAIEVINLGVCGYSSLQGLVLLSRTAASYEPDVITLSYGSNDFSLVPEPFDAALERNRGWSGALREWLHLSRAYQVLSGSLRAALRGGGEGDEAEALVLNVGPEKSEANMAAMAQAVERSGGEAIFVTNCARDALGEPIRRAAARTGRPILDTEALLEGAIPLVLAGGRPGFERYRSLYGEALLARFPHLAVYLGDHCHPNAIGHELIAEALAPMIEATGAFGDWRARAGATGERE